MWLVGLANHLRAGGLTVVERVNWETRGHGPMTDVLGVTCHHNAGGRTTKPATDPGAVQDGRSDLAGPLAHLFLSRDGTVYVVAAGLCYHAGVSLKAAYTNAHRIGIEAQAAGDGWDEDWPAVQMAAYALMCRVLAGAYGFDVPDVLGHKETCSPVGRKIDPSFSMAAFRTQVASATVAKLRALEDPGMAWADQHKQTATDAKYLGGKEGDLRTEGSFLRYATGVERVRDEQQASFKALTALIGAQGATIKALLDAVAAGSVLTPEQVQAAAEAGADAALEKLGEVLAGTPTEGTPS